MQGDFIETHAGYIRGDKTIIFDTGEQKWIRKVQNWKEQYPDEVKIKHENYEDGKLDSIEVELPIKWFKIAPTAKRNLTEEQRQELRDRMQNARSVKT